MSTFAQITRLSNYVVGGYKTVLQGRSAWLNPVQQCNYARKSAEEKLGLEKPKRPLTPFFKFMTQMRPALLAKNPGISSKEAIAWSSKHWQQLDEQTKTQMSKEYEKDIEDYKKIKTMYESSLTEEQKEEIKRVKEDMAAIKEKRKLKAEYKELGKPRRPMSSYFLFTQSRGETLSGSQSLKEFQLKAKEEWIKLSDTEKSKFDKKAQDLMAKYKKDIEAWELKMISMGRADLVRSKSSRQKKPRKDAKKDE